MTSDLSSFAALAPAYPELLLAVGAVVLLLAGVLFSRERSTGLSVISIVLLVAVIAVAIWQPAEGVLFNGGFIVDGFARYMKFLVLGGSAVTLILSTSAAKPFGLDKFEYSILVLLATLGMMVMVSANDLMSLYVGLEWDRPVHGHERVVATAQHRRVAPGAALGVGTLRIRADSAVAR